MLVLSQLYNRNICNEVPKKYYIESIINEIEKLIWFYWGSDTEPIFDLLEILPLRYIHNISTAIQSWLYIRNICNESHYYKIFTFKSEMVKMKSSVLKFCLHIKNIGDEIKKHALSIYLQKQQNVNEIQFNRVHKNYRSNVICKMAKQFRSRVHSYGYAIQCVNAFRQTESTLQKK